MPTKIEWAEESLNIVTGCTKVSPGCANCYAEKMSKRLVAMGQSKYLGTIDEHGRWSGKVRFHGDVLSVPEKWRKPRRVFLNSMSDTFHESLDDTHIYKMLNMVNDFQKHTFIIATKRAERAKRFINYFCDSVLEGNPIPNLWLLVSVEDQQRAHERIPYLLKTNVVVRGISAEPLLGPLDLALDGTVPNDTGRIWDHVSDMLHWVIVGGESGPGARPMHPDWVRSIRDQCVDAGVSFFFKQWGAWAPFGAVSGLSADDLYRRNFDFGHLGNNKHTYKIGKKKAGRLLDGRTWDEYPNA